MQTRKFKKLLSAVELYGPLDMSSVVNFILLTCPKCGRPVGRIASIDDPDLMLKYCQCDLCYSANRVKDYKLSRVLVKNDFTYNGAKDKKKITLIATACPALREPEKFESDDDNVLPNISRYLLSLN